jgi:hypothetical protein
MTQPSVLNIEEATHGIFGIPNRTDKGESIKT